MRTTTINAIIATGIANRKALNPILDQNTQSTTTIAHVSASMAISGTSSAMHAYGMPDMAATDILRGSTQMLATLSRMGVATGNSMPSKTHIKPAMQPRENNGAATMFAIGDISDNCENKAAEAGRVITFEDTVSASGSLTKKSNLSFPMENTDANNGEKRLIPKTEPAERKKDNDTLTLGDMRMKAMMHTASELREADLLRAKNDVKDSITIKTARTAEIGIPANTR